MNKHTAHFYPPTPMGYYCPTLGLYQRGHYSVPVPPVKPYPPDPYIDQFSLVEALQTGTLFRWLYDPYVNPYGE